MLETNLFTNPDIFSAVLFEKMKQVNPGIDEMALYEFRYTLNNLSPARGDWSSIQCDPTDAIEQRITSASFYNSIQLKPRDRRPDRAGCADY
jgi:hypothetical protein